MQAAFDLVRDALFQALVERAQRPFGLLGGVMSTAAATAPTTRLAEPSRNGMAFINSVAEVPFEKNAVFAPVAHDSGRPKISSG